MKLEDNILDQSLFGLVKFSDLVNVSSLNGELFNTLSSMKLEDNILDQSLFGLVSIQWHACFICPPG